MTHKGFQRARWNSAPCAGRPRLVEDPAVEESAGDPGARGLGCLDFGAEVDGDGMGYMEKYVNSGWPQRPPRLVSP